MNYLKVLFAILMLSPVAVSCTYSSKKAETRDDQSVEVSPAVSIRVTPESASLPLNAAGPIYKAVCALQNGAEVPCTDAVKWEFTNPAVGTIMPGGEFYGTSTGTTDIVATLNEVRASPASLTVTAVDCGHTQPIRFVDVALESGVRRQIGKEHGPIYLDDVSQLTMLRDADGPVYEVTNLSGVECMTALEVLQLGGPLSGGGEQKPMTDLTPLTSLKKLRELMLVSAKIEDISALSTLTQLEELDLSYNVIDDISSLATLTRLEVLNLSVNRIANISALASLTQLKRLNILTTNRLPPANEFYRCYTDDLDYSVLSKLTYLTELEMCAPYTFDAGLMGDMPALESLTVVAPSLDNLIALSDTSHLRRLILRFDWYTLFPSLEGLAQLEYLDIGSNGLSNSAALATLQSLSGLRELVLSYNRLEIVPNLAELANLTVLDMRHNLLTDISNIASLPAVSTLELSDNSIKSLDALVENPNIGRGDTIFIGNNPLTCPDTDAADTKTENAIATLKSNGVTVYSGCN